MELFGESSDLTFSIERREADDSDHLIEICDVDILSPAGVPIASYDRIEIDGRKKDGDQGRVRCGKTTLIRCLTRVLWLRQTERRREGIRKDLYQYTNEELADTLCYVLRPHISLPEASGTIWYTDYQIISAKGAGRGSRKGVSLR